MAKPRRIDNLSRAETAAIQRELLATGYHKVAEKHGISVGTADKLRNLVMRHG